MQIARRFRAIVTTAALWSGAFASGSVVLSVWGYLRFVRDRGQPWSTSTALGIVAENAVTFAVAGAVLGGGFALLLTLAERNRRFAQLSLARVAGWGTGSGIGLASVLALLDPAPNPILFFAVIGLMGGVGATSMLAVARRGLPAPEAATLLDHKQHPSRLTGDSPPA